MKILGIVLTIALMVSMIFLIIMCTVIMFNKRR